MRRSTRLDARLRGAELRRRLTDEHARREHRLAAVLDHQVEVAALVALAAIAAATAALHAIADLARARHAVAGDRAQLVERAAGGLVRRRGIAHLVREVAGEEAHAH